MSQTSQAAHLRALHARRPLILPNAWDAASARVIELAGAEVIATTSAGVSWSHGRGDGQKMRRVEMIAAVQRIVEAVRIPVTADVEGGYGSGAPEDVAETVRMVIGAGAVGINLEDSPGRGDEPLLASEIHAERIRAARSAARTAGGDLVINARTDVYLLQVGKPENRFEMVVERANLYRTAGADCLFVPGVIDLDTIAALVRAIHGPVNIMVVPGAPSASALGGVGVARVSTGSALTVAALALTQRAAREMLEEGTYANLDQGMRSSDVDGMFARA